MADDEEPSSSTNNASKKQDPESESESEESNLPKLRIRKLSDLQEPDAQDPQPGSSTSGVGASKPSTGPAIIDLRSPVKKRQTPRKTRETPKKAKDKTGVRVKPLTPNNTPRKKATPRKPASGTAATSGSGSVKPSPNRKKLFDTPPKGSQDIRKFFQARLPKVETQTVVAPLEVIPNDDKKSGETTTEETTMAPQPNDNNGNPNNTNSGNGGGNSNSSGLSDISSDAFSPAVSGPGLPTPAGDENLSPITNNSDTMSPIINPNPDSPSTPLADELDESEPEVIDIISDTDTDTDDEPDDTNRTQGAEASLVLQPVSTVFCTPVKDYTPDLLDQVYPQPSQDSTPIDEPMDTSSACVIDPSPRTSHIRRIFQDKPGPSSETVQSSLPVKDTVANIPLDTSSRDCDPSLDIPADSVPITEDSVAPIPPENPEAPVPMDTSSSATTNPVINATGSGPAPPKTKRRLPLVPPVQKNAEEVQRRLEAHYSRLKDTDVSLSEVGWTSDVESSSSSTSTGTENDCPKRKSLGNSRIDENPVKVARRSRKKLTHVKATRRASLQSVSSNGSEEAGPSRKRRHSDAATTGSDSSGRPKKFHVDGVKGKGGMEPGKISTTELAKVIERCFLKRNSKPMAAATRLEQTAALEHFKTVVDECRDTKLYLSALQMVSEKAIEDESDAENIYWKTISDLFHAAYKETHGRATNKDQSAIKFLEMFYELMVTGYNAHSQLKVKLSLPLVGWIMQGQDMEAHPKIWRSNASKSFRSLLHFAFLFQDNADEFRTCMNWLNFVAKYYYDYSLTAVPYLSEWEMLSAFMEEIGVSERPLVHYPTTNYGIEVLKKIEVPKYGRFICGYIVLKALHFEISKEFKNESRHFPFLRDLARSSLVLKTVADTKEKTAVENKINKKGESRFHQACQNSVEELALEVELLLSDQDGVRDINAIDNAGNSCLHDTVYYGKLDIIQYLHDFCYKQNEKPGNKNLNLLLQNLDGNTPFHIAVLRSEAEANGRSTNDSQELDTTFPIVRKLIDMLKGGSNSNKQLSILFQVRNKKRQTLLECCPKSDFGNALLHYLMEEKTGIQEPSTYGGIELEAEEIQRIRISPNLQMLIAYWEYFDSQQRPFDIESDSEVSDDDGRPMDYTD